MKEVFVVADNIISPLGNSTAENFNQLKRGMSGIRLHIDPKIDPQPFYASLFPPESFKKEGSDLQYTKFEQLLIASVSSAMQNANIDSKTKNTILIICSTKGNISLLEEEPATRKLKERIALSTSAKLVADYFNFVPTPVMISHACISGLLGIITGMRLLQAGEYENAVVAGADVISKFILSGFQSFLAISPEPCRPFDIDRNGITLGEGAATVVLSINPGNSENKIRICSGVVSNDANHISGPSRTGEELFYAIRKALHHSGLSEEDIDFISAHGTATAYNDEMEARALTLAGLQSTPINSLKGYYGHTLGAAGLIESVVSIHSLMQNTILPTLGFGESGVSNPVNICNTLQTGVLKNCLKTASGFGGCNAAIVISKEA